MKQLLIIKEPRNSIKNAKDLFKKIQKINIDYSQENFLVICLNIKNQIIASTALFKGGLNSCILDPRTIFRYALMNNSSKIILAHNHQSGNLEPSKEDKEILERLREIGEMLEICVIDSVVFNEREFYNLILNKKG
ncbi:MAG: JAB domain-containing protein [Nanoarchaeota archaeon]